MKQDLHALGFTYEGNNTYVRLMDTGNSQVKIIVKANRNQLSVSLNSPVTFQDIQMAYGTDIEHLKHLIDFFV